MKRINLDIDKLMKRIALTIGILVLIATPLEARIWETETQCVNRYGAPNERVLMPGGLTRLTFHYSGLLVIVVILDGVSQCEVFAKNDAEKLNEYEIQTILQANANGREWRNIDDVIRGREKTERRQWLSVTATTKFPAGPGDKVCVAAWDPADPGMLSVRTLAFDDASSERQKRNAEKGLGGF